MGYSLGPVAAARLRRVVKSELRRCKNCGLHPWVHLLRPAQRRELLGSRITKAQLTCDAKGWKRNGAVAD